MIEVAKICVLGGSSINTPELFDALEHEGVAAAEVCLIGRSPQKLATVRDFSRRVCGDLDLETEVTATLDLRSGLERATFVINMVRVGGSAVWNRCKHVMQSFGLAGQALYHPGAISNLSIVLDYAWAMAEGMPAGVADRVHQPHAVCMRRRCNARPPH